MSSSTPAVTAQTASLSLPISTTFFTGPSPTRSPYFVTVNAVTTDSRVTRTLAQWVVEAVQDARCWGNFSMQAGTTMGGTRGKNLATTFSYYDCCANTTLALETSKMQVGASAFDVTNEVYQTYAVCPYLYTTLGDNNPWNLTTQPTSPENGYSTAVCCPIGMIPQATGIVNRNTVCARNLTSASSETEYFSRQNSDGSSYTLTQTCIQTRHYEEASPITISWHPANVSTLTVWTINGGPPGAATRSIELPLSSTGPLPTELNAYCGGKQTVREKFSKMKADLIIGFTSVWFFVLGIVGLILYVIGFAVLGMISMVWKAMKNWGDNIDGGIWVRELRDKKRAWAKSMETEKQRKRDEKEKQREEEERNRPIQLVEFATEPRDV